MSSHSNFYQTGHYHAFPDSKAAFYQRWFWFKFTSKCIDPASNASFVLTAAYLLNLIFFSHAQNVLTDKKKSLFSRAPLSWPLVSLPVYTALAPGNVLSFHSLFNSLSKVHSLSRLCSCGISWGVLLDFALRNHYTQP